MRLPARHGPALTTLAFLVLVLGRAAGAQTQARPAMAQSVVTFRVAPILAVALDGDLPGVVGGPVRDLTWRLTTNLPSVTVEARLSAALPPGVQVTAEFTAPAGGTSLGAVALSTTPVPVVTGVGAQSTRDLPVHLVIRGPAGTPLPALQLAATDR